MESNSDPEPGPTPVLPVGGGPAGVVETFPKENSPPGLLVAGVARPGWLEEVVFEPKFANGLLPPVVLLGPNRIGFCFCPGVGLLDGLAGVERPENKLGLVVVLVVNGFPLLEDLSPNTDDWPVFADEPNIGGVGPEVLVALPNSPEDDVDGV